MTPAAAALYSRIRAVYCGRAISERALRDDYERVADHGWLTFPDAITELDALGLVARRDDEDEQDTYVRPTSATEYALAEQVAS